MSRAITVRLDEADHAGLSGSVHDAGTDNARLALDRLVKRSRSQPRADAVELVADARMALVPRQ